MALDGYQLTPYVDEAGVVAWGYMEGDELKLFRREPDAPLTPVERRQVELDADRAAISEYAESFRGSVAGDLWGNTAEIVGHGGNSLLQAGSMAWGLFDDRQFRARADAALTRVIFHPIDSGVATYNGLRGATADYYGLPLNQQMKKLGDASFAVLSGVGTEKAAGIAAQGILRTGRGAAAGLRDLWARANSTPAVDSHLLNVPNSTETLATRRAYLNEKFGRTGDINSDINIRGNRETAYNFYRDNGYAPADIPSHIAGIDFTQPVTVQTLGAGKKIVQWQVPGNNQGSYYALSRDVTPDLLGINPVGTNWTTGNLDLRVPAEYVTARPVSVLRSTSASIWDTWSQSVSVRKSASWPERRSVM